MTDDETCSRITAQKYVDDLLQVGSQVSCDETNASFYDNVKLPAYYDEDLYKKGQNFFYKHIFAMFFSKFFGLLAILAIPTITKILINTKMSSTVFTAYRRYMATLFHMMIWYDNDLKPGSRLWNSISQVRLMHNSASKKSCSAGMHNISQKDMALTQFGFMGFALAKSKMVGIHDTTEEDWKGFIHIWRVVGHLMGIEDRFNLCRGSVEETKEICNILIDKVFRPSIERKEKDFLEMSNYLIQGLWTFNPVLHFKSSLCFLHTLVRNNNNSKRSAPTYFQLDRGQTINYNVLVSTAMLLKCSWFRIYQNYVQIVSLWIMKVFPFLAYYKFGISKSHVGI